MTKPASARLGALREMIANYGHGRCLFAGDIAALIDELDGIGDAVKALEAAGTPPGALEIGSLFFVPVRRAAR